MSLTAALFCLHAAEYGCGLVLAVRAGRQGAPLALALGVLGLYTLFTPWLLWQRGEEAIAGLDYSPHLHEALGVYIVGVGILIAAWAALPAQPERRWATAFAVRLRLGPVLALMAVYAALFLYGIHKAGVPLGEWVQWKRSDKHLNLFGKQWDTPLVDKSADGLVALGYLVAVAAPWLGIPLAGPLLLVFALAGFRYRALLLVGALLLNGWLKLRRRGARFALLMVVALASAGMAWLTLNRIRVTQRLFKKVDNDLAHFDLRLLANETNNSQTFRVLLGYYHAHGQRADGWGATPTFVLVRAIPARLFAGNVKPTAPLLAHIRTAYDASPDGAWLNPAVSNLEEYYLGYGMAGAVGGMALLALLCRWLASLGPVLMPLGTLFLFQLISRGYLPQQVDLAAFLALPVALLYLWQRYATRPDPHARH